MTAITATRSTARSTCSCSRRSARACTSSKRRRTLVETCVERGRGRGRRAGRSRSASTSRPPAASARSRSSFGCRRCATRASRLLGAAHRLAAQSPASPTPRGRHRRAAAAPEPRDAHGRAPADAGNRVGRRHAATVRVPGRRRRRRRRRRPRGSATTCRSPATTRCRRRRSSNGSPASSTTSSTRSARTRRRTATAAPSSARSSSSHVAGRRDGSGAGGDRGRHRPARRARARAPRRAARRCAAARCGRCASRACSRSPTMFDALLDARRCGRARRARSTTSSSATARSSSRSLADGRTLAVIGDLYVEPDARAVGVGEALATDLVDRAVAAGCSGSTRSRFPATGRRRTSSSGPGSPPARCSCTSRCRRERRRDADAARPRSRVGAIVVHDGCLLLVRRGRGAAIGQVGAARRPGRVRRDAARRGRARSARGDRASTSRVGELAGWVERTGTRPGAVPLRDPRLLRDAVGDPTTLVAGDDAADARWVPLADVAALDLVDGLFDFLVRSVACPHGRSAAPDGR